MRGSVLRVCQGQGRYLPDTLKGPTRPSATLADPQSSSSNQSAASQSREHDKAKQRLNSPVPCCPDSLKILLLTPSASPSSASRGRLQGVRARRDSLLLHTRENEAQTGEVPPAHNQLVAELRPDLTNQPLGVSEAHCVPALSFPCDDFRPLLQNWPVHSS